MNVNVQLDSDLVAAVNAGSISQETALLTQVLRNQEQPEVKKKESNQGLVITPRTPIN